jgi:hypothetical protein
MNPNSPPATICAQPLKFFPSSSVRGFPTGLSPLKALTDYPAMGLKDFGKVGRGSSALPYVLLAGNRSHRGDDGSRATAQDAEIRHPPELGRTLLAAIERNAKRGMLYGGAIQSDATSASLRRLRKAHGTARYRMPTNSSQ